MVQIDKIETNNIIYHIAASPNATNKFTSSDLSQEKVTSWINVSKLNKTDTNNVILNKTSKMFRNIRYLKNIVGNGFDTTNTISAQLNNKLGKDDKISINQMSNIVSNTNENSTNKIPLLSIVYTINENLKKIKNDIDKINIAIDYPNNRYDVNKSFTFNNVNDVDAFCNKYNRNNLYKVSDTDKLSLGNKIQINDGTYNKQWIIAGFDLEKDRTSNDGIIKDNGYGILLIPDTTLGSDKWNDVSNMSIGYAGSYMNQTVLPNIANKFKSILGNHLINRNVLLKDNHKFNENQISILTTAYLTLMSIGQANGAFGGYLKEDSWGNGEANYKLPLFDHTTIGSDVIYWTRIQSGYSNNDNIFCIDVNSQIIQKPMNDNLGVRPVMMIR